MAAFHLDYYCGKDLYSDGKVEDVIFEIVTNGLDYYNYQGRDDYFAIMYHLSPERENIWNWYPFQKSDSILKQAPDAERLQVYCAKRQAG